MATVDPKIENMVRRLVERVAPAKVILFGSWARGEARLDSDVDLLVVIDDDRPKRAVAAEAYRALQGCGLAKDIVVVRTDELRRYHDAVGSIVYPAVREGRVLYERAA